MARCQGCWGIGLVEGPRSWRSPPNPIVCPDCGGSGIEHCCEGLREQPSGPYIPGLPVGLDPNKPSTEIIVETYRSR
jgi:hypothetical protein